jgi:hypothetical protein
VLQPIREFGDLLFDLSGAMPYRVAQSNFDPFFGKGLLRSYWKSLYLDDLGEDAIDVVVRRAADRPAPQTVLHIPLMGGATGRVAPADSAFGDRSAAYMLSVDGNWTDPADDERATAWTREVFAEAAALPSARGTYLSFSGDAELGDDLRRAAYGENLRRLREVKHRFDPTNLFRLNNNVLPAGGVDLPGPRTTAEHRVPTT